MKDKLNDIFKDILKTELHKEEISVSTCPEWDSLNHLNLILAIEEEFEIDIPPENMSGLYADYTTVLSFIETAKSPDSVDAQR